ncbi:hypothetical protein ABE504_26665 [Paenibacillus oryzisoli]|uniref:hypothetical protein n=1 Tax=Paenibacillus oryzisoli TaxID=1850517 RepID=UPI003D268A8F
MIQQLTPKVSLQKAILNLESKEKVERAINALLKNDLCEISFSNVNIDLLEQGDQVIVVACHSVELSWEEFHKLLDFYGDSFQDVFEDGMQVEPDSKVVRLFNQFSEDQSFSSLEELKNNFERSAAWTRIVLSFAGLVNKMVTFHLYQTPKLSWLIKQWVNKRADSTNSAAFDPVLF